jgi:hypothetical protein
MTVFYVRAKLHFSPTRLPIEPGATLKRAHTLSPKTHMRLDHFGHNYEFSVTARSLTLKTSARNLFLFVA